MALYEIRRDGHVLAQSSVPDLGYSPELLRQMEQDGYIFCIDGKPRRKRGQRQSEKEA